MEKQFQPKILNDMPILYGVTQEMDKLNSEIEVAISQIESAVWRFKTPNPTEVADQPEQHIGCFVDKMQALLLSKKAQLVRLENVAKKLTEII